MASTRRHLLCRLGNLLIISRSYTKGNSIETTILRYGETCDKNSTSWSSQSATIYEVVAALTSGCDDVMLWDEFDVERKADLGFPSIDVGIDYLSENGQLAGQAKNYVKTLYVKTDHMVRTQLCAYTATLGGMPLSKIEFTTRKDTKMGRPLVRPEDFTQRIVDEDQLRECFSEAIALMPNIEREELLAQTILPPLRECQISALKALDESTSTIRRRIRMAPGTGKSRIAIEYMKKRGGKWVLLVPSIVLVEQWFELLEMVGITAKTIHDYRRVNVQESKDELIVVVTTFSSANKLGFVENNPIAPKEHSESDDYEDSLTTTGSEDQEDDTLLNDLSDEQDCDDDDINMDDDNTGPIINFDSFDGVVIDEAHHIEEHAGSIHGPIWRGIRRMETIKGGSSVVCFSASLDKDLGNDVTYEYGLREAIDQGILVDYNIVVPIWLEEPSLEDIAKFIVDDKRFSSILAYCNTIESCKKFVDCLRRLGETAEYISGEEHRDNRREKLDRFRGRGYRILVSVQVLSEGVNIVGSDTCILVEPRRSPVSIVQCAGRVLRLCEGKKKSWIIVPSGIVKEEQSDRRPVVRILQVLGGEDSRLLKGKGGKKSGRLAYETAVKEKDNEDVREQNELLVVEIYNSDTISLTKGIGRGMWYERAVKLVDWWIVRGKGKPSKRDKNVEGEERSLVIFYHKIRGMKTSATLPRDVSDYLDDNIPQWDRIITLKDQYYDLISFYTKNNRLPKRNKKLDSEHKLANQLTRVRGNYKKNKISNEKKDYLDAHLPNWNYVETIEDQYRDLIDFYINNKRLPKKTKKLDSEHKLATQLGTIKQSYRRNKLSKEQLLYLNEHLGDVWVPDEKLTRVLDSETVTTKMKTRFALLLEYKGDRPLKPTKDPYSGNLLQTLRKDFTANVSWVTPENIAYLDAMIVGWRPKTRGKE